MNKEYRLDDLKIIDELLCMMRGFDESWEHLEYKYNITNLAISRLRDAYFSGEMKSTTASLAIYFDPELKK
jgi:hypothetical protein